jgi:hypothetical protein
MFPAELKLNKEWDDGKSENGDPQYRKVHVTNPAVWVALVEQVEDAYKAWLRKNKCRSGYEMQATYSDEEKIHDLIYKKSVLNSRVLIVYHLWISLEHKTVSVMDGIINDSLPGRFGTFSEVRWFPRSDWHYTQHGCRCNWNNEHVSETQGTAATYDEREAICVFRAAEVFDISEHPAEDCFK